MDPRVETGITVIMDLINRSAYLNVAGVTDLRNPEGCDILALILGLELGYDEDELKGKHFGEIDEPIQKALPMLLWGRTFGRFGNDVFESPSDGWDVNSVTDRPNQVNSAPY